MCAIFSLFYGGMGVGYLWLGSSCQCLCAEYEKVYYYYYLERILKTRKQRNKNFIKNIFVFLTNNFITTNEKEAKFYFSLHIGQNKIVKKENNNFLGEILVSSFSCFSNPFPETALLNMQEFIITGDGILKYAGVYYYRRRYSQICRSITLLQKNFILESR